MNGHFKEQSLGRIVSLCLILIISLIIPFATPTPSFSASSDLTISNYQLVNRTRVGRTAYDYTFTASVTNNGTKGVLAVTGSVLSLVPSTQVIDSTLTFGDVPAGATVASNDAFTVRINRSYPFNEADLSWQVNYGVSTVIGLSGGTALSDDGRVKIDIPAGVLPSDTPITVAILSGIPGQIGSIYEFGPTGLTFPQPVTITMSYDPTSLSATMNEADLFVASVDDYMEILKNTQVDSINHSVSGNTTHFSKYTVGGYEATGVTVSDFDNSNLVATSFRMPIGDNGNGQDLGYDVSSLLSIGSYSNGYPKIEFNASNVWIVATAFNKDYSLINYYSGAIEPYSKTKGDYHPGEDWNQWPNPDGKVDLGKPIHPIADGIVLMNISNKKGFGNIAVIGHKLTNGEIIASIYAHMLAKAKSPITGIDYKAGDIVYEKDGPIGYIGDSGAAAGAPHLHFEIIKGNNGIVKNEGGLIKLPKYAQIDSSGLYKLRDAWPWPGTDTAFISENYCDPSYFIKNNGSCKPSIIALPIVAPPIAAGYRHTLALKTDGTVWAWGNNANGQLGDGTNTDSNIPVQVSGLTGVAAIAGGYNYTIALKADGTVWTWGYQLGNGTLISTTTPVEVSGLTGIVAIASGRVHALALKTDGTVWAWGYNGWGELGNGTNTNSTTPVQVSGLTNVAAIAGGHNYSIALKTDGTVWSWGSYGGGAYGDGTYVGGNIPEQLSGFSGVIAIASGAHHFIALKSDGTVWTWGFNGWGQLGDGTYTNSTTPVQVSGLTNVAAIAGGFNHTLVLKTDGIVWAWGYNGGGQLGNGTLLYRATPMPVSGLTGVSDIVAGAHNIIALKSDGTVWALGDNYYGQLGNGTNTSTYIPVQVNGFTTGSAIIPLFSVSPTATTASGCSSDTVTFTASGGTGPYTWSTSEGGTTNLSSSTGTTVIWQDTSDNFCVAGGTITVTVTDSAGGSASGIITVW